MPEETWRSGFRARLQRVRRLTTQLERAESAANRGKRLRETISPEARARAKAIYEALHRRG